MNGIHDLGGMHGMGPIGPEAEEPVFHEDWERRMFGMFFAAFARRPFNATSSATRSSGCLPPTTSN